MLDPHLAMTIEVGTIAMIIKTDINLAGQYPIPMVIDTGITVKIIHEGVAPGHITNPHTTAHHATETKAHIATDETLHIEDPHHTELSLGIAVDPDYVHHTKTAAKHHQNCLTAPTGQPGKTRIGNINKSPLVTHHPNITALMSHPVNPMRI